MACDMERDYKKDFPLLAGTADAYLDNAATAQRPRCVMDAEADFYLHHNANPLRGLYPLSVEATEIYEASRETVRIVATTRIHTSAVGTSTFQPNRMNWS